MSKNKSTREDLYNCIVIFTKDGKLTAASFQNIEMDRPPIRKKNLRYWSVKFPTATHVNVYGGFTRKFKEQIKIER